MKVFKRVIAYGQNTTRFSSIPFIWITLFYLWVDDTEKRWLSKNTSSIVWKGFFLFFIFNTNFCSNFSGWPPSNTFGHVLYSSPCMRYDWSSKPSKYPNVNFLRGNFQAASVCCHFFNHTFVRFKMPAAMSIDITRHRNSRMHREYQQKKSSSIRSIESKAVKNIPFRFSSSWILLKSFKIIR